MSAQTHPKLFIKKLASIAGVAGAAVLFSFPALAQTTPGGSQFGNTGTQTGQYGTTGQTGQYGTTGQGVRALW